MAGRAGIVHTVIFPLISDLTGANAADPRRSEDRINEG